MPLASIITHGQSAPCAIGIVGFNVINLSDGFFFFFFFVFLSAVTVDCVCNISRDLFVTCVSIVSIGTSKTC